MFLTLFRPKEITKCRFNRMGRSGRRSLHVCERGGIRRANLVQTRVLCLVFRSGYCSQWWRRTKDSFSHLPAFGPCHPDSEQPICTSSSPCRASHSRWTCSWTTYMSPGFQCTRVTTPTCIKRGLERCTCKSKQVAHLAQSVSTSQNLSLCQSRMQCSSCQPH